MNFKQVKLCLTLTTDQALGKPGLGKIRGRKLVLKLVLKMGRLAGLGGQVNFLAKHLHT